jgi:hypothetical protein
MSTLRDIALVWVFTLPVAALLSGCPFWLFSWRGEVELIPVLLKFSNSWWEWCI